VSYFLEELKRRNVFKVGAAYLVVSWLILQLVQAVREPLGLPEWTDAFFIVLLAVGLPLALIFAWAFELTPDGMKKTREVDKEASVTASTGRKLNYAIIATLALALTYSVFDRFTQVDSGDIADSTDKATAEQSAGNTSIAVLPFVNMSSDEDQEYFSDGISEELLNVLAKIPELRVAARTSSFQFKGQNLDIGKVAEQLKVDHVLEGSVRKANTRIRITAQLIQADTGYHLWSETYDRELTDIFGIQDEISAAIVAALSETLGLETQTAPTVQAAANTDAYNSFLLGQHLIRQRTQPSIEASLTHYERALELDPDYAPAHASLALASYLLTASRATYGTLTLDESLSVALPHIEKALALDPTLADAHAVKGLLLYAQQRHEDSIAYFDEALQLNPSHNDVRSWYSSTLEELGEHVQAFDLIKEAYRLDPLSNLTFNNYANRLLQRRSYDELRVIIDRFDAIDPARAASFKGFMLSQQRRAADAVETMLRGADRAPENTRLQAIIAWQLKNLGLIEEARRIWPFPDSLEDRMSDFDDREGDYQRAQQNFEEQPDDLGALDWLAWASLGVGKNAQALELADRYLQQLGDIRRPIDETNYIFVYDAWQRQDETVFYERIAPLQANFQRMTEVGLDTSNMAWEKAVTLHMSGKSDEALEALEFALSREIYGYGNIMWDYEILGWNELPRFVAVKEKYDAYRAEERQKLLKVACGEIGFSLWKPLEENCRRAEST
jgi:TolB-like protein